ncbi:unnamed protein product, partial [Closterium sp. NIES-65]
MDAELPARDAEAEGGETGETGEAEALLARRRGGEEAAGAAELRGPPPGGAASPADETTAALCSAVVGSEGSVEQGKLGERVVKEGSGVGEWDDGGGRTRDGGGNAVEEGGREEKEEEDESTQQCRICLEADGRRLIAPCQCRGTQRFVHRTCLDAWRAAKGSAFSRCSECRAPFSLRPHLPRDRSWHRLRFRAVLLRDHAALVTLVLLLVGALGVFTYRVFGRQLRDALGFQDRPHEFFSFAASLLALLGIVYSALMAVLCSDCITERHAHVLHRGQLTK